MSHKAGRHEAGVGDGMPAEFEMTTVALAARTRKVRVHTMDPAEVEAAGCLS